MKRILKIFVDVLPLIITITVYAYGLTNQNSWVMLSTDESFHFSLITVNALFGGFLYTNYSLLIGLLDNTIIEKIKNTMLIQKRNQHILRGIIYATVSVVAGLYVVLIPCGDSWLFKALYCLMQYAEIVFMVFLIIYFLLSLYEMSLLVRSVHSPQNAKTDAEIATLKEKIQKTTSKKD